MTQFLPLNNRPAVPRGHVDFKAVLRDRVCPHQLIRDYCPAIIELRCRRSDKVYTTSRIAGGSYRRLQSYSEAFSRIPTLWCLGDMSLQGQLLDDDCDQSACAMGRDAMQWLTTHTVSLTVDCWLIDS